MDIACFALPVICEEELRKELKHRLDIPDASIKTQDSFLSITNNVDRKRYEETVIKV